MAPHPGYRAEPVRAASAGTMGAGVMDGFSLPRRSRLDRYSRLLGFAKIVLPGAGLAILAVALLWQDIVPQSILRRAVPQIGLEALRQHEMSSPKFVGSDDKNRPYQVEAKSARLASAKSDTVILEQPKASMTLDSGNWVAITSRGGEFNQKTRIVTLNGEVYLFHDANYTFRTERATIDTAKSRAWGDRPVSASGPKGTIEAAGFRIEDKGQTIIFTGKTKVLLRLDEQDMKDMGGLSKTRPGGPAPGAPKPGE
ncbi:MAG: LPS export ABC transporter periplasmic protein LptC [Alphaproteobacteria bacterium]